MLQVIFGFFVQLKRGLHLAKFSIIGQSVGITSGRGKNKFTLEVSFKELEAWAKKMNVDTEKLMEKSFANACSGLKIKFLKVIQHAGGECGVPKFKDFEAFTNELRQVYGTSNRPMGGKLAEKSSIGAWKKNNWQIIGWKDFLKDAAIKFQDAIIGNAEKTLNDNQFRQYLHIKGIKEIPRVYTQNKREVIPEPFGEYVKEHLVKWAEGSFYKSLARMMQKTASTIK